MRQLVFALQFRGSGSPVPGSTDHLRATTSAASQVLKTTLTAAGVQSTVETGGGAATFESEVRLTGEGTFVESGRIAYGTAGTVTFTTVGQGVLGPSELPDLQRGAVIWEVAGGDGAFRGARGLITSNFTVSAAGEVVDNQFAQLYVS